MLGEVMRLLYDHTTILDFWRPPCSQKSCGEGFQKKNIVAIKYDKEHKLAT